ncbi:MAG: hypothetical protein JWP44_5096 [Mucilaginibacter sp.]|nr:hypothetical protein [Mucilaginibacter sp.]
MASRQVCRIGDQGEGICFAHDTPQNFTTTFTTGSAVMFADGIQICVVGTIGTTTCGHHTRATTGSGLSGATDGAIHRVGDVGVVIEDERGTYTATTGSPSVDSL